MHAQRSSGRGSGCAARWACPLGGGRLPPQPLFEPAALQADPEVREQGLPFANGGELAAEQQLLEQVELPVVGRDDGPRQDDPLPVAHGGGKRVDKCLEFGGAPLGHQEGGDLDGELRRGIAGGPGREIARARAVGRFGNHRQQAMGGPARLLPNRLGCQPRGACLVALVERDDRREEELEPAASPQLAASRRSTQRWRRRRRWARRRGSGGRWVAAGQFVPDLGRTLDAEIEARGEGASEQLLLPLPPAFADRVAGVEGCRASVRRKASSSARRCEEIKASSALPAWAACGVKSASCAAAASS